MKSHYRHIDFEQNRLQYALTVSALPYRRDFYRNGGFNRHRQVKSASGFISLLAGHFGSVFDDAWKQAERFINEESFGEQPYGKTETVFYFEDNYPAQLREIFDPPGVLFCTGNRLGEIFRKLQNYDRVTGIVGTRNPETVSRLAVRFLLSQKDLKDSLIVSGLARGIDYEAHRYSFEYDLATVGVVASGVLNAGPYQSRKLLEKAYSDNKAFAVISEVFPTALPVPYQFPRRNRLISALSSIVILMQAPQKSGAMITADYALEHNRDLICFDHPVFDRKKCNEGCRRLLEEGAIRLSLPEMDSRTRTGPDPRFPEEEFEFYKSLYSGQIRRISGQLYLDLSGP